MNERAMTVEEQKNYRDLLAAHGQLRRIRKMDFFEPYPKQLEFINAGRMHKERALIAANRVGKTEVAAYETACHLTGRYPKWWKGHKFDRAIRVWAAGQTAEMVRDVVQRKLCGDPGVEASLGSGYIPKDSFAGKPTLSRGVSNAYDTVAVRHISGNVSTLTFKSYKEGRMNFQADTLDLYWGDEESDLDIYSEARTRLATTRGISIVTLTPLKGRTDLVKRFLDEPDPGRFVVNMGTYDAGHFTREQADDIINSYPRHEKDARAYGVPQLGEGRVFLTPEEVLTEPLIDKVPLEWGKLWGIDFGIGHNFGAALIAWDREADVIHLLHVVRMIDATPMQHVPALRAIAGSVPVAWPHDGNDRDKGSGVALVEHYRNPAPGMDGLRMLRDHATWPEGGYSTELAVVELEDRCKTGRFKVAEHLEDFFKEYRNYHREKGLLVKHDDDILSGLFKALMMKRFAATVNIGRAVKQATWSPTAAGTDFCLFCGRDPCRC